MIPTNGQYEMGSGTGVAIEAGHPVKIPLVIASLPAGQWTLTISSRQLISTYDHGVQRISWPEIPKSEAVILQVVNDPAARAAWEAQLLSKIRQGDGFARHVAVKYQVDSVIQGSISDLASADLKVALAAAQTLFGVRPLPPNTAAAISKAVTRQLTTPNDTPDENLLAYLVELGANDPSDEMLKPVLAVAHHVSRSSQCVEVRVDAVNALRCFRQQQAADELQVFLTDPEPRLSAAAKNAIANPWPPKPTTRK